MKIKLWAKILLVIWMWLMPTTYFLLAASPERGGIMSRMPAVVGNINSVLLPLFQRDTGS